MHYFELWQDYLHDSDWYGGGHTSAAVRIATTDKDGQPVVLPAAFRAQGRLESGIPGCEASNTDGSNCFTGGTAGNPPNLNTGRNGWRLFDTHESGLDWMWKENYLFDPIPSSLLRRSGPVSSLLPTEHAGGRGARREWWGWTKCPRDASTGRHALDEAWAFPWATDLNAAPPSLLNTALAPNGTEVISEVLTPSVPSFKGLQCYAETITAFFRPKRTARYRFKLWSNDEKFARLYFNPRGTDPNGAISVASARHTRFREPGEAWGHWNNIPAVSERARSELFDLTAGELYYMKVYHAGSFATQQDRSQMRLTLVMAPHPNATNGTWEPPHVPPTYDRQAPCTPSDTPVGHADSPLDNGEIEIDLVDDSWLVVPHTQPQVSLKVGETLARCDGGVGGCRLPTAAASSQRRLVEEPTESLAADVHGAAKLVGKDAQSLVDTIEAGVDEDDEDDDHIKHHDEAVELPDVEDMPARAPLVGESSTLRELRRQRAATAAEGMDDGGGHGRRLSAAAGPLRWSDGATWGALGQPNASSTPILFIPNGTHLLIDVPAVYIRIIVVEGTLSFADELDITLGAEAIIINHGELHIGSEASPFTHNAVITLHGHWQSAQLPIFGIKLIGLTRGKIFMHGQPKTPFVNLAATAAAASTTLTLASVPTGWLVDDSLIVTTSDHHEANCTMLRNDACHTEEVSIAAINGATVTLSAPLRYAHVAETINADGRSITLTCEVANLNRNVKIQGSTGTGTAGFGGHVMLLQPTDGESSFHHVELTRMGQAMRVGRYPLHLHAVTEDGGVGNVNRTSLIGVSVHHSFNRGINIHGGTGALVQQSIIYKNLGHAFFVEDGSETKNSFIGNLGALTMRAMSLLESDQTPSTYWITNLDNNFEGNIAAGGDAFGFWVNLPRHPGGFLSFTGATFRDNIFPRHALPGTFANNTAHSYKIGFLAHDVDPKVFNTRWQVRRKRDGWTGQWYKEVDDHPGMRRTALFTDFVTYSNAEAGMVVADCGHLKISNFVSAKQPSGLETMQYIADQWGDASNGYAAPLITDSIFVGDGVSTKQCGIHGPMSSFLTIANTSFHGFATGSAGICACRICDAPRGGQEVRTQGLRFSSMGVGSRLSFDFQFEAIFHDLDGSLTGMPRSWMHGLAPDGSIGHFPPAHCSTSNYGSTNQGNTAIRAMVCTSAISLRTFRFRNVNPQSNFRMRDAVVRTPYGNSSLPWMVYDILIRQSSHHFTVATGTPHSIDFASGMAYPIDHSGWSEGEMCELRADEYALVEVPTLTDPLSWTVSGNQVEYPASYGALSALGASHRLSGFWQYTRASVAPNGTALNGKLQMLLSARKASISENVVEYNVPGIGGWGGTCTCADGQVYQVGDTGGCAAIACINGLSGPCSNNNPGGAGVRVTCAQSIFPDGTDAKPACDQGSDCHKGQRCVSARLTRNECPPAGCNLDTDRCMGDVRIALTGASSTAPTINWCVASSGWTVPTANANVTIPAGTTVTLSGCTTALVNRLDILGTLQFVDGSASTLKARYIHVAAYTGRLEAGTLDNPFMSVARIQLYGGRTTPAYPNSGLGSKFLAVFGELSLVGAPKPARSTWTQLSYTADAGDATLKLPDSWAADVGLRAGDELIVSPSTINWDESEVVTVAHINETTAGPGAVDTHLTSALVYGHTGLANATWLETHSHPFLAAEVALLRTPDQRVNNVVVEGMYEPGELSTQSFGAVTYIFQKTGSCPMAGNAIASAQANISGALFQFCGQRGWGSRGCVQVGPQQQPASVAGRSHHEFTPDTISIVDTTIADGYNTGIQLDRVHGVSLEGNVIARVQRYGMRIEGQRNRVLRNLILHVADSYGGSAQWGARWSSGSMTVMGLHHTGRDGNITGNVIGGSEGYAVFTDGYECGTTPTMSDNTAHSAKLGVWYEQRCPSCRMANIYGSAGEGTLGATTRSGYPIGGNTRGTCYELSDWKVHSTVYYGAHSGHINAGGDADFPYWGTLASLRYVNFTMIDTGIAFSHAGEGPRSDFHDRSRPDLHWEVIGATVLASNYRCRQVGFVAGSFHNIAVPFGPHGINMFGIRNAPTLYGGSIIRDTYFDGFGTTAGDFQYASDANIGCSTGARNLAITNDAPAVVGRTSGERAGDGMWAPNPDSSNPVRVSGITFGSNVESTSHYGLLNADTSFIGDTGCAQIDCDGRRNALIIDEDGSLIEGGQPGTIVAQNEIRFNSPLTYVDPLGAQTPADLVPPSLRIAADGSVRPTSQMYSHVGISRHSSAGSCNFKTEHNAYECSNGKHRQLIVEDITHSSMERRIAPVALLVDGYISLATGPQNYARSYVTTTARLNTFWLTAVLERTHDVHFASTAPDKLRLHLRDVSASEWLLVRVNYGGVPNRVDVYASGARIAPAASAAAITSSSPHGTSFHDVDTTTLTVLMKGNLPIDLQVAPVITLGMGLSVTMAQFFSTGYNGLVSNIALLLGIPQSRIRVPGAASGGTSSSGRRASESSSGGSSSDINVLIDGESLSQVGNSEVVTVQSTLQDDLASQSITSEMQSLQSNLTSAAQTGALAEIVTNTTGAPPTSVNVSAVDAAIPGWTGATSDYSAANGCDCGYGIIDPDCTPAPTAVRGCEPLSDISTLSASEAAAASSTSIDEADTAADALLDDEDDVDTPTGPDLTVITPTRTCAAQPSVVNVSGAMMSLTLGVCDYSLPHWQGSGSEYNKGNGVCDCARGLWDPDCAGVDFTSPELNASSFGCPTDGQRYICYKEERTCFTSATGGRPLGVCLIATASPSNCPAMNSALALAESASPPLPPPPSPVPSPPPSPFPSLPPAAPTPEGKVLVPEIQFETTVAGTVETFDDLSYKTNLAALLGVDKEQISLLISAASVRVVATVTAPDVQAAQSMASALGALNATTASAALGETVENVAAPVVALVARDAPPPPQPPPLPLPTLAPLSSVPVSSLSVGGSSPPPAPSPSSNATGDAGSVPISGDSAAVIAILAAVVVLGLVLVIVTLVFWRKLFPRASIDGAPKQRSLEHTSASLPRCCCCCSYPAVPNASSCTISRFLLVPRVSYLYLAFLSLLLVRTVTSTKGDNKGVPPKGETRLKIEKTSPTDSERSNKSARSTARAGAPITV